MVDGTTYNTSIYYDSSKRTSSFANNTGISSLSFHAVDGHKFKGTYDDNVMNAVFKGMGSLESIHFGDGYDSSGSTGFGSLFQRCSNLTEVDLENLDFSEAKNYNSMFTGCSSLEEIDLSYLDFSKVNNITYMFDGCESLTSLDFSGHTWPSSGTTGTSFLSGCNSLTEIIIDENVDIRTNGFSIGSVGSCYGVRRQQRPLWTSTTD